MANLLPPKLDSSKAILNLPRESSNTHPSVLSNPELYKEGFHNDNSSSDSDDSIYYVYEECVSVEMDNKQNADSGVSDCSMLTPPILMPVPIQLFSSSKQENVAACSSISPVQTSNVCHLNREKVTSKLKKGKKVRSKEAIFESLNAVRLKGIHEKNVNGKDNECNMSKKGKSKKKNPNVCHIECENVTSKKAKKVRSKEAIFESLNAVRLKGIHEKNVNGKDNECNMSIKGKSKKKNSNAQNVSECIGNIRFIIEKVKAEIALEKEKALEKIPKVRKRKSKSNSTYASNSQLLQNLEYYCEKPKEISRLKTSCETNLCQKCEGNVQKGRNKRRKLSDEVILIESSEESDNETKRNSNDVFTFDNQTCSVSNSVPLVSDKLNTYSQSLSGGVHISKTLNCNGQSEEAVINQSSLMYKDGSVHLHKDFDNVENIPILIAIERENNVFVVDVCDHQTTAASDTMPEPHLRNKCPVSQVCDDTFKVGQACIKNNIIINNNDDNFSVVTAEVQTHISNNNLSELNTGDLCINQGIGCTLNDLAAAYSIPDNDKMIASAQKFLAKDDPMKNMKNPSNYQPVKLISEEIKLPLQSKMLLQPIIKVCDPETLKTVNVYSDVQVKLVDILKTAEDLNPEYIEKGIKTNLNFKDCVKENQDETSKYKANNPELHVDFSNNDVKDKKQVNVKTEDTIVHHGLELYQLPLQVDGANDEKFENNDVSLSSCSKDKINASSDKISVSSIKHQGEKEKPFHNAGKNDSQVPFFGVNIDHDSFTLNDTVNKKIDPDCQANKESDIVIEPDIDNEKDIFPHRLYFSNPLGETFELAESSSVDSFKSKCVVKEDILVSSQTQKKGNITVTEYRTVPTELLKRGTAVTSQIYMHKSSDNVDDFILKTESADCIVDSPEQCTNMLKENLSSEETHACDSILKSEKSDVKKSEEDDCNKISSCSIGRPGKDESNPEVRRDSLGRAIIHFCRICKKKYHSKHQVDSHMLVKHTLHQKYKCDQCVLTFPFRRLMLAHVKSVHKTKSGNTHGTRNVLVYPEQLGKPENHNNVIAWDGNKHNPQLDCCFCRKKVYHCGIVNHFKYCHSTWNIKYLCSSCGSEFKALKSLARHINRDPGCTKLFCAKCEIKMGTMEAFREHNLKVHPVETAIKKSLVCHNCGKVFTQHWYLQLHLKRCKKTKKLAQECGLCARSFVTLRGLQTHVMKSHSNKDSAVRVKPYICSHCDLRFSTRNDKIRHISQNHRNFKCTECQKSFINESKMKRHQVQHLTEKTFSCPICQIPDQYRSDICVRKHMRRCHPEKFVEFYGWDIKIVKYVCEICDKSCLTRSDLQKHMRTHTNERPFACEHCTSAFKQRRHLKEHKMYKHKEVYEREFGPIVYKHICNQCESKFLAKCSLNKHLKMHERQRLLNEFKDKSSSNEGKSSGKKCNKKTAKKKVNAQKKNLNKVINKILSQNAEAEKQKQNEKRKISNEHNPTLTGLMYESIRFAPSYDSSSTIVPSGSSVKSFQYDKFHVAVKDGQVIVEDFPIKQEVSGTTKEENLVNFESNMDSFGTDIFCSTKSETDTGIKKEPFIDHYSWTNEQLKSNVLEEVTSLDQVMSSFDMDTK